jgi:hypothetical protein
MSMVIGVLPNVSLYFDGWLLALTLVVMCAAALTATSIVRRKLRRTAFFGSAVVLLGVVVASQSLLATPRSWEVLHAAYESSPLDIKSARQQDIAAVWLSFHEDIRLLDWYRLAHRWGVCHELWVQSGCTYAPLEREAMGIARELLTDIARGGQPVTPADRLRRPLNSNVRP